MGTALWSVRASWLAVRLTPGDVAQVSTDLARFAPAIEVGARRTGDIAEHSLALKIWAGSEWAALEEGLLWARYIAQSDLYDVTVQPANPDLRVVE